MPPADRPRSIEALVPQRGPALLLETVLDSSDESIVALGRVPFESPFLRAGMAPCFLGLELMAQAAGAFDALRRGRDEPSARSEIGYLVGIRGARFDGRPLPAGERLRAEVRQIGGASPLAVHEGRVFLGSVACLSAVLSTFRPGPARNVQ